jgi:regulatory protein
MEDEKDRWLSRETVGRISAIQLERSGSIQRAAVYVDDRLATYALPSAVKGFETGQTIYREQLRTLREHYERSAYLQAIRFLSRRDRSVREVQQHLRTKGWDGPACERAVDKLRQAGFLEDKVFAQKWVDYRARTAPRSCRVMAQELEQKGIARETIHDALAAMDEKALALACAKKKMRQWQRYAGDERRKRIMVFLQRKGFPYIVCRETAQKMVDAGQDD